MTMWVLKWLVTWPHKARILAALTNPAQFALHENPPLAHTIRNHLSVLISERNGKIQHEMGTTIDA